MASDASHCCSVSVFVEQPDQKQGIHPCSAALPCAMLRGHRGLFMGFSVPNLCPCSRFVLLEHHCLRHASFLSGKAPRGSAICTLM